MNDGKHAVHKSGKAVNVGATQFIYTRRCPPRSALNRCLGHIVNEYRLKFGRTANDRQNGAKAAHRGKAVKEAVLVAENHRRSQDNGCWENCQNSRLARAF